MDAYTLWKGMPFPRTGHADLVEVREDLLEADYYVTSVVPFAEQGLFKPSGTDVLAFLDEVMLKIDRLCEGAGPEVVAAARPHHAYAALLRLLYGSFLEEGRKAGGSTGQLGADMSE